MIIKWTFFRWVVWVWLWYAYQNPHTHLRYTYHHQFQLLRTPLYSAETFLFFRSTAEWLPKSSNKLKSKINEPKMWTKAPPSRETLITISSNELLNLLNWSFSSLCKNLMHCLHNIKRSWEGEMELGYPKEKVWIYKIGFLLTLNSVPSQRSLSVLPPGITILYARQLQLL